MGGAVGEGVGEREGDTDGDIDGEAVGVTDGVTDGDAEGDGDGVAETVGLGEVVATEATTTVASLADLSILVLLPLSCASMVATSVLEVNVSVEVPATGGLILMVARVPAPVLPPAPADTA